MRHPDPFREITPLLLASLRGANYWHRGPVTRLDLRVGAYEEISSAEVPGFADALVGALPGLLEHRCSVGERGGFLQRLRRGTYAPHIIEHVALELQDAIGHRVGFGRARGAERSGEYTIVLEHRHAAVGRRAASQALDLVRLAFAERDLSIEPLLDELRALALLPDEPPPRQRVLCAVSGGPRRAPTRRELAARLAARGPVIDVAPVELLSDGLPYACSRLAVLVDGDPLDVPGRFQAPDAASQLLSVLAEAIEPQGAVIVSADERELQARVQDAGARLAIFTEAPDVPRGARQAAALVACVRDGRIVVARNGEVRPLSQLDGRRPAEPQLVTALATFLLEEGSPETRATGGADG